jgi:hypothetical protein
MSQVARSTPFNKNGTSIASNNVQGAIEEVNSKIDQETIDRQLEDETIYNSITAYRDEIFITAGVIANGTELSANNKSDIMPNSVFAFVDRLGVFENFDFELSDGPNNKVVLNFSPSAIFSPGNPSGFIEGGEFLRIHYLTKIK